MKKQLLLLLSTILLINVTAQERTPVKRPGQGKARMHQHMLAEKLKLSAEQREKVKSLNEDFRKQLAGIRKNEDLTVKEWKSKQQDLAKKHRENMQNLLTDSQKDQIKKARMQRAKIADINANARMEKMKLRLDLSKDQLNKMKQERTDFREKMKAIHENKSLDRQQKTEAMRSLMQKRKESMKSLLNDEQKKQLKQRQRPGPNRKKNLS